MKRRQIREIAFQIIYQIDVGKNDVETSLLQRIEENDMNEKDQAFCRRLVTGTIEKLSEIDRLIEKYALEWKVDRMLSVDRNILRLAIFEMKFLTETPPKVALNEAIELAKKYGSEESPKFINGILDRIINNGE
ncbi:MAG: transcription antitermination factor NusB [Clostridia bacterium]|nr:transcription antitermination factor NusB [Clostridia bacterium]